ncbi:MAG TPA: branched-chain amino acid ABC transporter substrate-binding protein [Bosea sp. (in: a-proteobacteria)]|jgi:branched-chain amino acid transport system substrate-binding protein|uniref:branched-chain amino acid ABC transporter substrate-binding protein n=1 Tax=Bosea sp. (in: a-proteobacteria) TaxID=1871050 RepID=UPI002E12AEE4|nr:branched-chain amino acid ABC transporter substrate-binding protein [Bosea sp. (in: a-proteobacteria)]
MKKLLLSSIALGAVLAFSGVANAQIKLGVGGPITGPNAAFGAQLKNGTEMAVEDINAAGGVLGQKLSVTVGDDVSDPKQGVSVANKFVGDGVKWVVGHFNSGVTMPASEVYAENGILMISPSATNPKITERGLWNTFRTCGRDDQQGEVAAAYVAKNFKDKKIAIVHDKTTYGQGLADETRKGLTKAGIKDVLYEGINAGEKDFSALISKIKSVGADFVYWGGLHTEGGLIVRQMRDQGVNAVLISGDGITTDEFATIGGPGVEGTLMTFPPDPQKRPEAAAIVKKFEAKNFKPEAYTLYSYAAVQIMAEGAKRANSADPKKIAEALKGGQPVKTVIGDISFDKKGDITRPDYTVYTWKKGADGKVTYVEN